MLIRVPEKGILPNYESKMVDIIFQDGYQVFLNRCFFRERILDTLGIYPNDVRRGADMGVSEEFGEQNFGEAWNNFMLKNPRFCGKMHEFNESVSPSTCVDVGNPCCGHPDRGKAFHTLGVGSYIATGLSGQVHNPAPSIRKNISLDVHASSLGYITLLPNPPRGIIKFLQEYIRWREKRIWKHTISPYRQKVAKTLQEGFGII
ncbi:hypothetical protein KA050_03200 [Candidatus Gracilibacteria bacterium]|nr:hypothetical protein [Candidatus Gracilibacteria bacterium]